MMKYILKLYITGNTPRSQRAIANLLRICQEELSEQYQVEIVDVLEQPEMAEQEKILVTPTLIKQLPPPIQRIIGDMSNTETLFFVLDLVPNQDPRN